MAECAIKRGREILLSLIYPMREENMTETQREGFERAADVQEEYMQKYGTRNIRSETLGDARVTYADDSGVTVSGEKIAPEVIGILRRCGLLDC